MSKPKFKVRDKVTVIADIDQLRSIGIHSQAAKMISRPHTEITRVYDGKEIDSEHDFEYRVSWDNIGYIIPEKYLLKS